MSKWGAVMGNLRKPLNFPLVWTRKGAVVPRRSNWYCAARFTCWEGNFALWSQSTACRVVRYFWCLKAVTVNFMRRGPIPGCSHVLSVLGIKCEWLLWRAYTLGYSNWGIGRALSSRGSRPSVRGWRAEAAELTGVSARKCEWLVS